MLGDIDPGWTIARSGETHSRRGHRPNDRSPSPDRLGPWAFGRRIQRAPFPQHFNGGHDKGKAKRDKQDMGPSMQKGQKNKKNSRQPVNSALVAVADNMGKQPQHFNELMKSPSTNHSYPVKHLYKDFELLKRLL